MRISNSFSEGEIQVMDFILSTLLRGGTPNMAVRSKDFASLCRKIQSMKTRVAEVQLAPTAKTAPKGPERSSVGLIETPDSDSEEVSLDSASGE